MTRPAPSPSDVVRAFADAMQAAGFLPPSIETDTEHFVRFDAPGDKKGKANGFYKLKLGDYPVGWFGDWKTGEQVQWFYQDKTASPLTDAERAAIKREQARLKADAAAARDLRHAEIAEQASAMWKRATSDTDGFQYLARKQVEVPKGLKLYTAKDGTRLLAVPMYAFDGNGAPQLTNLQLVDGDGKKQFLKGGKVEGAFFSIRGEPDTIVICEGVATGFSIWKATGLSVVIAFNSGNLKPVADQFSKWREGKTLLIAADNDEIAPDDWGSKPWVNAGVKAAKASGCAWVAPVFAAGPARDRTDFNDLHLAEGEEAVETQILAALRPPAPAASDEQPPPHDEPPPGPGTDWEADLPRTSAGSVDGANVEGVALYIGNHRLLRDRLRFNLFTKSVEIDNNEMEDHHVAEFRRIMHGDRFKAKKPDVKDEMLAEARRHQYDPLVDYLQGLKWDGSPRLDRWMVDYLGAPNTAYSLLIGRKSLLGAVARALSPGCKNDTMPVLEGEQGSGKSTALRMLFGDRFFVDHLPDFHSKDSFQQLQGAWCVEVAELSALGKADIKDVKQFLSRLVDKYRPPYGTMPIHVPRRSVFWGTVNPEDGGYLRDPTGARRFWPVETNSIDMAGILRDRDQLWGEAVSAFIAGEAWHLEGADAIGAAKHEQAKRREIDPWEPLVEAWARSGGRTSLAVEDILSGALMMDRDRQEPRHTRRVGAVMRALGWKPSVQRLAGGKPQRVFLWPSGMMDGAPVEDLALDDPARF